MVEFGEQMKPYFTRGGQGKLFPDPKPVAEHRYQRGFTPERMAEVRAAPLDIARLPKRTQRTSDPFAVRQVHETLARSTTPVEEMKSRFRFDPVLRIQLNKSLTTAQGLYKTEDSLIQARGSPSTIGNVKAMRKNAFKSDYSREEKRRGVSNLKNKRLQNLGHLLLHELGHHRSTLEGTPHSWYTTPEKRGHEEAFADVNMLERYRPDPRDVRHGKVEPFQMSYERAPVQEYGWVKAYNEKRRELARPGIPTSVIGQQKAAKEKESASKEAATALVNDQLFHRDYAKESASGPGQWTPNPKHIFNDRRSL